MPTIPSDNQAPSGNVDAAAKIFAEHGSFIRGVILSQLQDPDMAEDIFQGFFLSLATRNLPSEVNQHYLYRAILHDIIDTRRRSDRYSSALTRVGKGGYDGPILQEDPVRKSIDKEEISRMLDMLEQRLHPTELEAIRLRYHKELAVEDIAQHMGVESKTVTGYVSVGLKKIRDFLQKTEGIIHDHP